MSRLYYGDSETVQACLMLFFRQVYRLAKAPISNNNSISNNHRHVQVLISELFVEYKNEKFVEAYEHQTSYFTSETN